jgi:histidyl-tRNA synthetase
MDFAPPRGTQDFLPPAGERLRALYERASDLAELHGFRYVETPAFDHTELFARTAGDSSDVVAKEMYTFEDRGGRSLTLVPEGTAPVMRAYLHHQQEQPTPFRAYYVTRMYRFARPQKGRYREHRQFGIEVFGTPAPAADVEVIALGDRFLRDLGLSRYHVEVNSIGDGTCRPAYREELLTYLRTNRERMTDEHRDSFEVNPLRVLDCKDDDCRAVAAEAPRITDRLCPDCRTHFDAVVQGLGAEGIQPTVTPTLVRGLDYYVRTAFEFVAEGLSVQQGTLFGGGRYDGLAEALGGPPTPGVGFGMGLERVLLALEQEGVAPPKAGRLRAFVVALGDEARDAGRVLVSELRAAGVSATSSYEDRPLKAQLKQADHSGAVFAAIVGEREIADGTVTLRSMTDGTQETVPMSDAVGKLREGGA